MFPESLFRVNALKNLTSLTDVQQNLQIIKPHAWFTVIGTVCLMVTILIGITWVKLAITIPVIGIIIDEKEFLQADKLWQENINEHQEKLTAMKNLFNQQQNLFHQHYLTINELEKGREDYLQAKEQLAEVRKQALYKPLLLNAGCDKKQILNALVFVTHKAGKKIKLGMDSYILPDTQSAFKNGYKHGRVISVSTYPVSKEVVYAYLGNMSLVDEFFGGSVPYMVRIALDDVDSKVAVEVGTMVTGDVVERKCSVSELLL